jgi:hypothetical protein
LGETIAKKQEFFGENSKMIIEVGA